ncbi:hypothetical protein [Chryseobacterium gambrini]|uniref:hypothetical protein n=1 Tax=Chryseobacterium gambrini TaxID=373672 RepID=UPI0022F1BE90|nr:hypothetical protein [Chryseobacterium gambrini]WBV51187.1 hypothetical protein PFY09_12685 [Chryseobacterium gambrini]
MKNKTKILTTITLFVLKLSFAQSNFSKGYNSGYSSGYCQDKPNCISPISPIPPIPTIDESPDSYKDGYNRGFKDGLGNNTKTDRERYKTSKPKFYNYERSSNNTNELLLMLLQKKKQAEEKVQQNFQEAYSEIQDYEDNDSEEIKKIKSTYLNKIENLANNSASILTKTNGDYKYLISLLQKIYDEFYDEVNKK